MIKRNAECLRFRCHLESTACFINSARLLANMAADMAIGGRLDFKLIHAFNSLFYYANPRLCPGFA